MIIMSFLVGVPNEPEHVLHFHGWRFVRPPDCPLRWCSNPPPLDNISISLTQHAPPPPPPTPRTTLPIEKSINSKQEPCNGRWSASPTRYFAIGQGAAHSSRLCLPPIERRTAPPGEHSTSPVLKGKIDRKLVRKWSVGLWYASILFPFESLSLLPCLTHHATACAHLSPPPLLSCPQ